jgi:hypothetical protein
MGLVAPARVLCGQPEDQLLNVVVHRRSSWFAAWVGPGAGDHAPVPTQPRLGLDEEARPAGSGQDAADGREQGPVGRLQPGSRRLAAQDDELVAQDEELEIFGGVATGELGEQLNRAAERQVGELRQHQGPLRVG